MGIIKLISFQSMRFSLLLIALLGVICYVDAQALSKPVPKPVSKNGRCGPHFGNTRCTPGAYCSRFDWCGGKASHGNPSTHGYKGAYDGVTKPAAKKPVAKKPVAKKPVAKKPVAK